MIVRGRFHKSANHRKPLQSKPKYFLLDTDYYGSIHVYIYYYIRDTVTRDPVCLAHEIKIVNVCLANFRSF